MYSVGLRESTDRPFPEPRLAHRPQDEARYGAGNKKDDEQCCKDSVHADACNLGVFYLPVQEVVLETSSDERVDSDRSSHRAVVSATTIGIIYVVVGLIGVVARPRSPNPLRQLDPYLAIPEALIISLVISLA